ncbi:DUF3616 domain-containing protein [Prosthecodimorpha staleyi]|uniref:DUF3616 domain-containing protein n=1 Tax=Prosthecodimorpha staleyi TaxID=2840188 RepID=A0A947D623_9HYPH|nr:DUF3616 domain-containing protein [Prosthecodimorpha staleyi]MBT9291400.1 DUF3616 domain-containing protein [Prosthecodimorpha staleyi]
MSDFRTRIGFCFLGAWLAAAAPAAAEPESRLFNGMCDASAAVPIDAGHFVVASDEDNTLRIYALAGGAPSGTVPLAGFLRTGTRESDLEGAARIGDRIYWIASHGRNSSGKLRAERQRLFATDIVPGGAVTSLAPAGTPSTGLLPALLAAPALAPYGLAAAAERAPEAAGGLNIEGLAATPDGRLLVGFRNPLVDGKALVVTLDNPADIVAGAAPAIGAVSLVALGGRGIRSLERIGDGYLIVAGPTADAGSFALYRWSGGAADPIAVPGIDFGTLRPEALFAVAGSSELQILSDDGGVKIGGAECKSLPAAQQHFRGITVTLN